MASSDITDAADNVGAPIAAWTRMVGRIRGHRITRGGGAPVQSRPLIQADRGGD
ncbi:MAG: hypothetical protein JWO83_772 [Caulobacteraceae bacterium]|nr:hypothetical protein [Caulobacteraceae bacterium]